MIPGPGRLSSVLRRMEAELNDPPQVSLNVTTRDAKVQPVPPTNLHLEKLIRRHRGVILSKRDGATVRMQQPLVIRMLRSSGPEAPAIFHFAVEGVGKGAVCVVVFMLIVHIVMAHVKVYHFVFSVSPHNRVIAVVPYFA